MPLSWADRSESFQFATTLEDRLSRDEIHIVEDLIRDSRSFDVHSPEEMPSHRYFTSQFDNKSS